MSGDGTYIEYVSTGDGPPAEIPYPPLTHNPHDPVHYYQGNDGRYYYAPDGKPHPEFGQPQVKDTPPAGHPSDPLKRSEAPNADWKHEADKGYHMTPTDLRTLANKLEGDLNGLQPHLDRVTSEGKITAAAVGDWASAGDFLHVSDTAFGAFTKYYQDIVTTYTDVINKLRTTANNGEKGEDATHRAVTGQQANYQNPSASGNNANMS